MAEATRVDGSWEHEPIPGRPVVLARLFDL